MKDKTGKVIKDYEKVTKNGKIKINSPNAYCANCGQTYMFYSFGLQPDGFDRNKKAFFHFCFKCSNANITTK